MAERIQARAIRRCGELYNQIEPATGKNNQYEQMKRDGTDTLHSRAQAATDAGLSERQRKMAERIQARAIRRYGELLKQIEPDKGGRPLKTYDATDIGLSRSQAAREAGISERQKVTALRIANIPIPDFESVVESDSPRSPPVMLASKVHPTRAGEHLQDFRRVIDALSRHTKLLARRVAGGAF